MEDKRKQLTINISGKVIHGDHYGRVLGFPTANLDRRDYAHRRLKIKLGVWAGGVRIKDLRFKIQQEHKAAIVIGPIDKKGLPKIEAHLLGFKGNLYGKKLTIDLVKFIRPFKKYKNVEKLKEQIREDIQSIKKIESV